MKPAPMLKRRPVARLVEQPTPLLSSRPGSSYYDEVERIWLESEAREERKANIKAAVGFGLLALGLAATLASAVLS